MTDRRLRPGARSTWITTRGFHGGDPNSDGSGSEGDPVAMSPPRIGAPPAIWHPYGLTSSISMVRSQGTGDDDGDGGGDGESESNSDDDEGATGGGNEGPALYRDEASDGDEEEEEDEDEDSELNDDEDEDEDDENDEGVAVYSDGHSDVEMHTMVVAMDGEDSSSGSDSDVNDADGAGDDGAEYDGRDRYPAWRANVASFEDLPSLVGPESRRRAVASPRQPRSKSQGSASPFIPKYLESTAYGALYRRQMLGARGSQNGAENGNKVPGSQPTAASGHAAETARVAPDMFFQSLVQDTWPHYCMPVPTMPPFVGLQVGFGLGIRGQGGDQNGIGSNAMLAGGPRRGAPADSRSSDRRENNNNSRGSALPWRTESSRYPPPATSAAAEAQPRSSAQSRGKKAGATAAQAMQLPSGWAMPKAARNLEVDADRVTVHYTGPGRLDTDAAMVLSDVCIPPRTGVYYFEMTVKSRGQRGYIGVGLANPGHSLARLPGWDAGSWGYHGDDGNAFSGGGHGKHFGPRFTTGDTVGCGFDFMRRRMFFTHNGVLLGYAFEPIEMAKDLHPCVGMRTPGEYVSANFGRAAFVFDIDHFVVTAREEALKMVGTASLSALMPSREAVAGAASTSAPAGTDPVDAAGALALRAGSLGATPHKSAISGADAALSIVLTHLLHSECYGTARALIQNA
ncbi:hypothetical protein H4R19_002246, partial [Coemansia spiralis]